jgi:phosphoserine aminotransferase
MPQAYRRVYNFSPGPATLPEEVLLQAQKELLDWQGLGLSAMEISHHAPQFREMIAAVETDLRELLAIPKHYKVLFLQGGGRSQFAMVPLNLLRGKKTADYIETGVWSRMALTEASRYCDVNIVASSAARKYSTIPAVSEWQCNPEAAYFHYADNETVNGVEFPDIPAVDTPLVSDMSSSLLTRVFDVSRFALIYAAAQKNIGPAGITIVIVREDLLGDALPFTPTMFNYKIHADAHSLYNTPPTYSWYIISLVLQWLKKQGGVAAMETRNQRKAEKLYRFIDDSGFYQNEIDPTYRSRMNVIFRLPDETLNTQFLEAAQAAGLHGLKGHSMLGGMRASIYNAMPEAGVDALIEFMQGFQRGSVQK